MASLSTPTSMIPIQQKYDVFISFRGTDTRDNITSHVYAALCREKIETFIDNDLERGDVVSDALLRTIAESKISLIIFSENYASSRWCLDELVKIMDCNKENGQIVVPVFFKVDPSHVRNQSGPFGQGLAAYEGHPKIQIWRNVLTNAANLSGWNSQVTRPEAMLIERVVKDILDKLYYIDSSNFGDLVGMSPHFEQIESLLSMINEDVRIIGLWGMGGIGKTTLARAFFNHNLSKFEGHCIIEDIRETCEKRGLNELRDKLFNGILRNENLNIGTPNLGISFIRDRFRRKKLLIVLDDVNNFQHIQLLVGQRNCLGSGSIVIITSRDKQVLKNGVDRIYEVPQWNYNDSLCLFSRFAFKQELPLVGHQMRLSYEAVNYAKGNPLALKILGSHLYGRSKQEQESALRKLERTPNKDVQQVLLISYDGLDHQEKNMFLNIACFFKGVGVDEVKYFHDACNYSTDIGFAVLIDKSLITVQMGHVRMHDLLQEMGRQIVHVESIIEPGERSRLWDYGDISHVLTNNTGTRAIKGILLEKSTLERLNINSAAFERMHNLEFLEIRSDPSIVCVPHGVDFLPNKLRYMGWNHYPLTYLPSNFVAENLVKLKMCNSHVERLWNGRQNLVHLNTIFLTGSKKLIEIPDLSLATNLECLYLGGCSRLKKFPEVSFKIRVLMLDGTAIEEIPSTICNLKSLNVLDLGGCTRLKNLPTSIYKLKSLWHFGVCFPLKKREHQLEVNMPLRELTEIFIWSSSVETLNLSRYNFQKIPVAIKQLTNLKNLILEDCWKLQSLPQLPKNVRFIYAANCISLETVASPLSMAARGDFDSYPDYMPFEFEFHFQNCWKLDKNARNSIVSEVESKLLHLKANHPESKVSTRSSKIIFPGGDVSEWFNYKSRGSSLTVKLPTHWCDTELFCLVFSIVLECNDFPNYFIRYAFYLVFHIRNNRGVNFNTTSSELLWSSEDAIQSNQVCLIYNQSLLNDWGRISKGADDADEISIEFLVKKDSINYCAVKKCGLHLLYTRDIEDRYCRSVVQPNSPCGDLTQFFLKQECVDDVEESVTRDAKDNGGCNDNSFNVGNPIEELAPVLSRKKMKWKLNTFRFTKFLRVRQKSTRKVSRNYCKVRRVTHGREDGYRPSMRSFQPNSPLVQDSAMLRSSAEDVAADRSRQRMLVVS